MMVVDVDGDNDKDYGNPERGRERGGDREKEIERERYIEYRYCDRREVGLFSLVCLFACSFRTSLNF